MNKMRLLLSAAAMLGVTAAGSEAARITDMTGNPNSPTGTGIVTDTSAFEESGGSYTGGQGLETESMSPFSVPAPGTVNMRLNLEVNEYPTAAWWTGMNGNGTPAANAGNKQQAFGIMGWVRLDFGIDGMSKNGVQYGAFTEIRENNTTAVTGSTTSATSGFAQSASADAGDNTLYVRQAFAYIGTDHLGIIRIGTGFAADTLLEIGLNDEFDIGGWNFFTSTTNIPSNITPVWPWADDGGEYMAGRIAYLSPVIDGVDAVVSFAPNNSTPFDGSGCSAAYGGVGCATQSSSTDAGDIGRYRNQVGIGLRYRNMFGPVGLAMSGIWTTSGKVNPGPFVSSTGGVVGTGTPAATASGTRYNGENIGNVGAQITFNHVLSIGGNVMWGAYNGNWGLQPVGGATAIAWVAGVKYTFPRVPMTIGGSYFDYKYQGQAGLPTQRTSQGIDLGVTYGLGPGVVLVAEYAWGQNYQGDYDFLTGATGTSAGNKVQSQIATAGISLRF
jgi:hypothetical protein